MKKLACLLLLVLVASFSFVGFFCLNVVHAETDVSGTIASNTTWSQLQSPYMLTGPVDVASGVTLTIEPGVTVNFNTYGLQVDGELIAVGSDDSNIVFCSTITASTTAQTIHFTAGSTEWNASSGTGSVIENAVFNPVTLTVDGNSPRVSNNTFRTTALAITVNSGSPQILNNIVVSQCECLQAEGSPTISGNLFESSENSSGGNAVVLGGNAYFSGNKITRAWVGLSDGILTVSGNTITNCYIGIYGGASIQNNYIANCHYAIGGSPNECNIRSNSIINNEVGIVNPSGGTTVTDNNICGSTQYSIQLVGGVNVNATYNWWGTTNTQAINQTIYDNKNDSTLGTVTFVPFLTSPSTTAPSGPGTINVEPVPTPQTGQPSANPTVEPANSSSPTATPQNPSQGQVTKGQGGFNLTPIATAAVVVVPLLVAVLIIVIIRKRTFSQRAAKNRKKR